MKVFLSWSGDLSHRIALILREWLPLVIQALEPYVSSVDIRKGARWAVEIGRELEASKTGVLCVTPESVDEAWLNFEAGALFKALETNRVIPLLFGLRPADLEGPLAQFQATVFEKEDVWKLIVSLNKQVAGAIPEERLRKTFDAWWPELERRIGEALKAVEPPPAPRVDGKDVPGRVDEILESVREQGRAIAMLYEHVIAEKGRPPFRSDAPSVTYVGRVDALRNGSFAVTLPSGQVVRANNRNEMDRVVSDNFRFARGLTGYIVPDLAPGQTVRFVANPFGIAVYPREDTPADGLPQESAAPEPPRP